MQTHYMLPSYATMYSLLQNYLVMSIPHPLYKERITQSTIAPIYGQTIQMLPLITHCVYCERQARLLYCDLEIGVDCAFVTYSGVELVVKKTVCRQFHEAAMNSVCSMHGTVSTCWDKSWGLP